MSPYTLDPAQFRDKAGSIFSGKPVDKLVTLVYTVNVAEAKPANKTKEEYEMNPIAKAKADARSKFRAIREDGRYIVEHKATGEKHGWYESYAEALAAGYAQFGQPGVGSRISIKLPEGIKDDVGETTVVSIDFWDETGERDTAVDCRIRLEKRGGRCDLHWPGYWWEATLLALLNPLPGGPQLVGPVGEIDA